MYGNSSLLQELRAENVLDGLTAKYLASAFNVTEGVGRSTCHIRLLLIRHNLSGPVKEARNSHRNLGSKTIP
jgi:hypothetical protein